MITSPAGRKAIMEREGVRLRAYRDSVGVWTIGVGHTSMAGPPKVTPGLVITRQQADDILSRDLNDFERTVNTAIKQPLSQGQFDALVSLAFNIGAGGFKKSTVVRRINEGNYRGAADAFLLWNKPPELMPRRRAERAQFLADSGKHVPGEPVRYMPKPDLHEEEDVNADYLRASGSRVVKGADTIQNSLGGMSGAAVAAGTIATNVSSIHDSLESVGQAASDTKDMASWFAAIWPWMLVGFFLALILVFAWRIWRATEIVQQARVQDAAYDPKQPSDA